MKNNTTEWNNFYVCKPTEKGDYWIYRNRDGNLPRIFHRSFSLRSGGLGIYKGEIPLEWTHWAKIEKPKPPKK